MALPTACPLCGASADQQSVVVPRVYGDDTRRAVFACAVCDVRYLFPGLAPDEEQRLYAAEFESFMAKRSGPDAGWEGPERHIAVNEAQRQRRMKHLAGLIAPNSRILKSVVDSDQCCIRWSLRGTNVWRSSRQAFSRSTSPAEEFAAFARSALCDCGSGAGEFDLISSSLLCNGSTWLIPLRSSGHSLVC